LSRFFYLTPLDSNTSIVTMHRLDEEAIANLEKLARIRCTPEEKAALLSSLSRVLDYIHLLQEVDVANAPACHFVSRGMIKKTLREDEVKDLLATELFLSKAPDRIDGMVRVPPILKNR